MHPLANLLTPEQLSEWPNTDQMAHHQRASQMSLNRILSQHHVINSSKSGSKIPEVTIIKVQFLTCLKFGVLQKITFSFFVVHYLVAVNVKCVVLLIKMDSLRFCRFKKVAILLEIVQDESSLLWILEPISIPLHHMTTSGGRKVHKVLMKSSCTIYVPTIRPHVVI